MSEPEFINDKNFLDEIDSVVESFDVENDNPKTNLEILSKAIIELCEESNDESAPKRRVLTGELYFELYF